MGILRIMVPGMTHYGVSCDGRVWSKKRGEWKEIVSSSNGKWGYLKVNLDSKTYAVHRVVARTFLGQRPEGFTVNHIDGSKGNNSSDNLEYCTYSDNMKHAYRLGLRKQRQPMYSHPKQQFFLHPKQQKKRNTENIPRGVDKVEAVLTEDDVRTMRKVYALKEKSLGVLAKEHCVSKSTVWSIVTRKKWKHVE